MEVYELKLPALEIHQGPQRVLYAFAVDGKTLPTFTTISRIRRESNYQIYGYQRHEVRSHINEIRKYLESDDPMIPNSVVVAFDRRVSFQPAEKKDSNQGFCRFGTLRIPVNKVAPDEEKPGWIVDGQQRVAAIREASMKSFPVFVVGFIAKDDTEQREQFILVNSTKPLPKGLIYELLPTTKVQLPTLMQRRRFPALLVHRLNSDDDSPFKGLIGTPTNPEGIVKDNSVLKMIENSISDGALFRFRDPATGEGNAEVMLQLLKSFWAAVARTFRDAWAVKPRFSRLMHGAGIVSMGYVMDAIADRLRSEAIPSWEQFQHDLEPLREVCRWTDGYWEFGPGAQRKWNEVQNTFGDIQMLSNYLLVQYKARVWSRMIKDSSVTN